LKGENGKKSLRENIFEGAVRTPDLAIALLLFQHGIEKGLKPILQQAVVIIGNQQVSDPLFLSSAPSRVNIPW